MKKIKILTLGIVIAIAFTNCTTTKRIQKNMNSGQYSLTYLHDSEETNNKSANILSIGEVNYSNNMNDTTKVEKLKSWAVPLIFVNVWKSENKCIQGKSMFQEDIPDFMKQSLTSEINRSGTFNIDTLEQTEYKLIINIDSINTVGPYTSSGTVIFAVVAYSYSYADIAGPAISTMKVNYQLYKGADIVLENTVDARQMTQQINKRYTNDKFLQRDYSISMVEAVSFNIKKVNEQIVNELNEYFNTH